LNDIKKIQSHNILSSPASRINKKVQEEVTRLMNELMQEDPSIKKDGKNRAAQYFFSDTPA